MAENIKIYRNSNPRLGFILNESSISNIYVDEKSLLRLVQYINKQFLICSNKQTQYLQEGCVDPKNQLVTIFCIAIMIPFVKSIYFNSYEYIVVEYLIIFLLTFSYLISQFLKSDRMKEKYIQSERELEEKFQEIQEEFNSRFDYLQMEYNRSFNESEEDYLEIKILKIPVNIKSLQNRFRSNIQLLPILQ